MSIGLILVIILIIFLLGGFSGRFGGYGYGYGHGGIGGIGIIIIVLVVLVLMGRVSFGFAASLDEPPSTTCGESSRRPHRMVESCGSRGQRWHRLDGKSDRRR